MANVNELNAVAEHLYSLYSGDSVIADEVGVHPTLNIIQVYEQVILQGATYPCIRFSYIPTPYGRGSGGRKVYSDQNYRVEAWAKSNEIDFTLVANLANRIEVLSTQTQFQDHPVVMGMSCYEPIKYVDDKDGELFVVMGSKVNVHAYNQES